MNVWWQTLHSRMVYLALDILSKYRRLKSRDKKSTYVALYHASSQSRCLILVRSITYQSLGPLPPDMYSDSLSRSLSPRLSLLSRMKSASEDAPAVL